MSDPGWIEASAAIAARWEHGHDALTDGCTLCNGEYDEARGWCDANQPTTAKEQP